MREQTEKGLFSVSRANTNNGLRREVLVGALKAAVCLPRALDSTQGIFGFTEAEQPEARLVAAGGPAVVDRLRMEVEEEYSGVNSPACPQLPQCRQDGTTPLLQRRRVHAHVDLLTSRVCTTVGSLMCDTISRSTADEFLRVI